MRKILFFVAFFGFAKFNAQTTQLKVSESAEFKDKERSEGILALHTTPSGNTVLVRGSKNNFLVDVFDEKLNQVHSEMIECSKKESFYHYVSFENDIKFITVYAPSKRERAVYCYSYNVENKKFSKKELFTADVEKGGLFSGRNKRKTDVVASPNGKYFAIATDNIKKNLNSYMVHVFNASSLELVFKKSYQEHEDNYFQPNDFILDNLGNAFILGKLFFEGKSQKVGGEANYNFMLYKLSKDDTKSLQIKLPEGKHVASLRMNLVENKLNILGFYSEEEAGRIKGGCNFNIDTNQLSIVHNKNTPLPKSVYDDLYSERKAERLDNKKKEFKAFYVDYVLPDGKGNTYILAEEFFVTMHFRNTGPNGTGYWETIYHYDDILVLKFDPDGDISWGRSIFKKENNPSYNAFLKNNQLHIILNSGKNLVVKSDGRTKVSTGFMEGTSLYDINYKEDGTVSYDVIQRNKGNNFYEPNLGTYNNEKFILISSGKNKQFMLLE